MRTRFSERLVKLRGDLSRSVICRATGIKPPTYAAWEYGRNEPGIDSLVKLAKYFGVSGDFLLGMEDGPGVRVTNNGDHSPVASSNVNCSECPLTRTVERQAALIEQLSQAAAGIAPKAPAKQARK